MTLLVMITALAIGMALTPLMIQLAPRLRMVDLPDPRKVHAKAIPRVGGIGIVVGSLASLSLWMPPEPWLHSYLLGSLVLLCFGAADDSMELGHYPKFVGQIVAAVAVVYWGDVWVAHVPFLAEPVLPSLGKPFTVFAMVGVMNAINHSDGLDGLAGGESLLSMAAIGYLAYVAGATSTVLLAAAVIGGVFGFLRFNTHPARVFMGDAGSQFIGFSVGVLAVLLTQQANTSLSMALPALLIGLPIVDILAVFWQRIHGGMNWFRATRNHIHHRLLDLGFKHHQVVTLIYSVQALLVMSGLVMAYESDMAVSLIYVFVCGALFAIIMVAERRGWRVGRQSATVAAPAATVAAGDAMAVGTLDAVDFPDSPLMGMLHRLPILFVKVALPTYLLLTGLLVAAVPHDFAVVAAGVLALAGASALLPANPARTLLLRLALYLGAACQVFLIYVVGGGLSGLPATLEVGCFVLLGVAVALSLRFEGMHGFKTTPLDFLMAVMVVVAAMLSANGVADGKVGAEIMVRLVVLFYAAELIVNGKRASARRFSQASLIGASLLILSKTLALV